MTRPSLDDLRDALERGADALGRMHHPGGYWWEELEANSTITAVPLILPPSPSPTCRPISTSATLAAWASTLSSSLWIPSSLSPSQDKAIPSP